MNLRKVLAGASLLAYPVAVHWSLLSNRHDLAVLALFVLCLTFTALFISFTGRPSITSAGVVIALYLVLAASLMRGSVLPVAVLPLILNSALCWIFGRTLVHGREALITRFARLIENEELPSEVVQYTRRITFIWCLAFGAFALEVALLAAFADPTVWSLFANVVNYLLILVLFAFEYGYRRWRFRHRPHLSPFQFFVNLAKADWRELSTR